jgi:hypothetical protein
LNLIEGRMQVVETLLKLLNFNESPKSLLNPSKSPKSPLLVAVRRVFIARGPAHVFP